MRWRAFGHLTSGPYIDVGAWDTDTDSVTRAFQDAGWQGINIEPIPALHAALAWRRPRDVNLAVPVMAEPATVPFHVFEATGLSTKDTPITLDHAEAGLHGTLTEVPAMTLAAICRAHATPEIHCLKIDCELRWPTRRRVARRRLRDLAALAGPTRGSEANASGREPCRVGAAADHRRATESPITMASTASTSTPSTTMSSHVTSLRRPTGSTISSARTSGQATSNSSPALACRRHAAPAHPGRADRARPGLLSTLPEEGRLVWMSDTQGSHELIVAETP